MKLNNILTSGYVFENDGYELRLKYILFNSLLIFNVIIVTIATFVRLANMQYTHALFDITYVLLAVITFFLARYKKSYFNKLVYFVIFFSYLIVTLVFISGLNPIAGISWYFILLMTVFFLKGNRAGIIIFLISLLSIIWISLHRDTWTFSEIALGIIPFIGLFVFMCFFEKRNNEFKIFIEKQKELYAHQAQYDGLTGVANRELFLDRLTQALKLAERARTKVAVFFIDLDHFKEINDSLGHHIGDEVLIEVASRLQSQIRDSDTFARLGGDEYAIIVNSLHDIDKLSQIIQKLFDIMKSPIIVEEHQLSVSLSLGITIYPDDGLTRELLLKNADKAMYKAKESGRNTYSFYSPK